MDFPPFYTGIADSLSDGDKRKGKYLTQYRTTGMDDSETWCLDYSICRYLSTRLVRFKEIAETAIVIEPEFRTALDQMIEGFSLGVESDGVNLCPPVDEEIAVKIDLAFTLLTKYRSWLWC